MKKLNENMMRKHNWDQLQNIQKKINKEGGDISSKLDKDYKRQSKTNNSLWINSPIKKGVDLSDNEKNANTHTDPQLKDLPKNSLMYKENVKSFDEYVKESKKESSKDENKEGEDRGNVHKIHRNMKTIGNWMNSFDKNISGRKNPKTPRNVLSGRQVNYGKDKEGYIEGINDEGNAIIQATDNSGTIEIKKFSEITVNYKNKD